MSALRCSKPMQILFLLMLLVLPACSPKYENERFSFAGPAGTEIQINKYDWGETLWLKSGSISFSVVPKRIPEGSDLQAVFDTYREDIASKHSHSVFISESIIQFKDRPATEYIYRAFSGEPYVQSRELWFEKDGWFYQMRCLQEADATPGLEIPIAEKCFQLAEGFNFK